MDPEYIESTIKMVVHEVRDELKEEYDIIDNYEEYAGLCDDACKMCKKKLLDKFLANVTMMHGEQRHHPRIESKNWQCQHTWMKIKVENKVYYIDPTSSQFKFLYKDIPDVYISRKKPKWYYSDRVNPIFNGLTKFLNKKIRFRRHYDCDNGYIDAYGEPKIIRLEYKIGIIEILQYDVWGFISDFIYCVKYSR